MFKFLGNNLKIFLFPSKNISVSMSDKRTRAVGLQNVTLINATEARGRPHFTDTDRGNVESPIHNLEGL